MKKNITISHFVTNGCSFTYGDELLDPVNEAWPAVLAKKFGVPVVNLACGGTSNDRIYRTTANYFFIDTGSNPFYIFGMTSHLRREEYFEYAKSYIPVQIGYPSTDPPDKMLPVYEDFLTRNADEVVLCFRKYHIWLSLINLMRATNTNYLTVDMLPCYKNEYLHVKEFFPKMYEYVFEDPNYIDDFGQLGKTMTFLPAGHYDVPSNSAIANKFYERMNEQYNIVVEPAQNLIRLKDFYSQDEKDNMQGRHAWL